MRTRSTDDRDNDPTDELPVLLETAELDEDLPPLAAAAPRAEETDQHTALFALPAALADERPDDALVARAAQVPALEAQIGVLTDSARELESRLAERDERLAALESKLADLERARDASAAAEQRLAEELVQRDARIAELVTTIERLERDAAAQASALQQSVAAAEAAQHEAASLRQELAAPPQTDAAAPDVQRLREDHAALAAYIAGRRAWWDELQAANTRLAARVAALEHELTQNTKRLAAADAFAEQESNRAVALRAELVDYARRVDSLERELRRVERPAVDATPFAEEPGPLGAEAGDTVVAVTSAAPPISGATPPSDVAADAPSQIPPVLTDAVETSSPGAEALAQLEAEVEYKRQQVAAQLVELRDREQRLRAITADLEVAQRELGTLRNELDESRANVARLERSIVDKDRALETRDARINTLQEELRQRPGTVERGDVGAVAPSPAVREAESPASPTLLCLTGEAPKRFVLTKKATTIGRGPHCDLQILTHFVSREHARLTLSGGSAFIEDLGSRNGVFVNAVRVDRQQLQHGDLLTIGETQFRFVESMAH